MWHWAPPLNRASGVPSSRSECLKGTCLIDTQRCLEDVGEGTMPRTSSCVAEPLRSMECTENHQNLHAHCKNLQSSHDHGASHPGILTVEDGSGCRSFLLSVSHCRPGVSSLIRTGAGVGAGFCFGLSTTTPDVTSSLGLQSRTC